MSKYKETALANASVKQSQRLLTTTYKCCPPPHAEEPSTPLHLQSQLKLLRNNALTQHVPCSEHHQWGQGDDSFDMQYSQLWCRRNAVLTPKRARGSPCWDESWPAHRPEAHGKMLCSLLLSYSMLLQWPHLPLVMLRPSLKGSTKQQVPLHSLPFPSCLSIPLLLQRKPQVFTFLHETSVTPWWLIIRWPHH